jgi:hypothetical protein
LKGESAWSSFIGSTLPILVSMVTIFSIFTIECICLHYIPNYSLPILYVSTTLLVLFNFYATPYLIFSSLKRERLAQKTLHEKSFMRRLVVNEIINILFLPIVFNILLVKFAPDNYRETI